MTKSLSQVYVHIVFSTKYRKRIIDDSIETSLHEYIGGICKGLECYPIRVGGFYDHIHVLCTLSKQITQMKLVEEIKKQSSKWIKTKGYQYSNFYWQSGYGIFSVSYLNVDVVTRYIKKQKQHHHNKKFKDEFRGFLKRYNIPYEENHIWD